MRFLSNLPIQFRLTAVMLALLVGVAGVLVLVSSKATTDILAARDLGRVQDAVRGLAIELSEHDPSLRWSDGGGREIAGVSWPQVPEELTHGEVERVAEITGQEITLFRWDEALAAFVRISTTIRRPDGSSGVGTILALDGTAHAALRRGEAYYGVANILGKDHLSAYVPINDGSGRIVGALFAGIDLSASVAARRELVRENVVASLVVALVGVALVAMAAWLMLRPLNRLTHTIAEIGAGRHETVIEGLERRDEIGAIARSLDGFRASQAEAGRLAAVASARQRDQQRVVDDMNAALARLAGLDLGHRIPSPEHDPFPDDYEVLRSNYNALADTLSETIASIGLAAESVRNGAVEFNQMAQDLSSRTETQAATLEESAAALDQLTGSVKSAADLASEADAAMADNRAHAIASGEIVKQAIRAMREIEQSSALSRAEAMDLPEAIYC